MLCRSTELTVYMWFSLTRSSRDSKFWRFSAMLSSGLLWSFLSSPQHTKDCQSCNNSPRRASYLLSWTARHVLTRQGFQGAKLPMVRTMPASSQASANEKTSALRRRRRGRWLPESIFLEGGKETTNHGQMWHHEAKCCLVGYDLQRSGVTLWKGIRMLQPGATAVSAPKFGGRAILMIASREVQSPIQMNWLPHNYAKDPSFGLQF